MIQQNGGGRYYSQGRPEVGHIMLGHPTTPVYFVPGKQNNNLGMMTGGSSAFSPLIVSQASTRDAKKSNDSSQHKVIIKKLF